MVAVRDSRPPRRQTETVLSGAEGIDTTALGRQSASFFHQANPKPFLPQVHESERLAESASSQTFACQTPRLRKSEIIGFGDPRFGRA